jgi:hypothetical protein
MLTCVKRNANAIYIYIYFESWLESFTQPDRQLIKPGVYLTHGTIIISNLSVRAAFKLKKLFKKHALLSDFGTFEIPYT